MEELIKMMNKRMDRLEYKIDHLISFKYKIIGAVGFTSFVVSLGIGLLLK